MRREPYSTLTAGMVADVLNVLQRIQDLKAPSNIEELAPLQARAMFAASTLRIHSGIDDVRVEVKESAE